MSIRCLSLWRQLCPLPAVVISMLTMSDLGRAIAKLLLELPHDILQRVVRRVELGEREVLTVGCATANAQTCPLWTSRYYGYQGGLGP